MTRVPGYIPRGPTIHSLRYQTSWEIVVLERGSLKFVRIIRSYLNEK
jgi:hypothetical protein